MDNHRRPNKDNTHNDNHTVLPLHKHRNSHSDNRYERQYPTTQDQYLIYIYIEDLEEFIKTQAGKQYQIVVMGDFNCDLNSKHNKMIQIMERYNNNK